MLVTDNGSHFAADAVTIWLNGIGCRHLFTARRHPCCNGQAENVVSPFKTAIDSIAASTLNELEGRVDAFLLQYRNAKHFVTKDFIKAIKKKNSSFEYEVFGVCRSYILSWK